MKVDRDYFYTYVKKKLRTNTKIGPFVNDKGVVINKPITEQLNDQYAAMWSTPLEDKVIKDPEIFFMNNEEDNKDNPILTEVVFTKEKVIKAIDMLEQKASAGPDGVPAMIVKKLKNILAEPITSLGNKSLNEGFFSKSIQIKSRDSRQKTLEIQK